MFPTKKNNTSKITIEIECCSMQDLTSETAIRFADVIAGHIRKVRQGESDEGRYQVRLFVKEAGPVQMAHLLQDAVDFTRKLTEGHPTNADGPCECCGQVHSKEEYHKADKWLKHLEWLLSEVKEIRGRYYAVTDINMMLDHSESDLAIYPLGDMPTGYDPIVEMFLESIHSYLLGVAHEKSAHERN